VHLLRGLMAVPLALRVVALQFQSTQLDRVMQVWRPLSLPGSLRETARRDAAAHGVLPPSTEESRNSTVTVLSEPALISTSGPWPMLQL
jgi:hypothetical protein